jgi:hypothetical protein
MPVELGRKLGTSAASPLSDYAAATDAAQERAGEIESLKKAEAKRVLARYRAEASASVAPPAGSIDTHLEGDMTDQNTISNEEIDVLLAAGAVLDGPPVLDSPSPPVLLCTDCNVNTSMRSGIGEYYMLRNDVWRSVASPDGVLCVGCIEARLGRALCRCDFAAAPVNFDQAYEDDTPFRRSARLTNRIGARCSMCRPQM